MTIKKLEEFVHQDLTGFVPVPMFLLGKSDDGREFTYKELYTSKNIVDLVAAQCTFYTSIKPTIAFINKATETVIFSDDVELIDEKKALIDAKTIALKKLLPEERKIFNLPSVEELATAE